ncbi:B1 protein [Asbolus verrucosus]|uniref:B1 protein n=1 Tax=Asbolus verrucosus TaxID=1661398 RepID=A0A482VJJ1_ASBVE|nr:B1 protein [Asbolus verrucosus]
MKFVCFLVIIALVAAETEDEQQVKKWREQCKARSGVSDETLQKALKNEPIDDPKFNENILCLFKKSGFMTSSGDIIVDALKNDLKENNHSDEAAEQLVQKCAVKKDTPQATAYHLSKCIHDAGH